MLKRNLTALLRATFTILSICSLAACSLENPEKIIFERPGYSFPYHVNRPGQSWNLPAELAEISGLSYIDHNRLACVQDEKGIIYIFNLKAGKIEKEIVFGENGDYEGIEIIENDAWILKSNGMLFNASEYLEEAVPVVNKYKTGLSGKNDTEGLAYDPAGKSLLIACKENPFLDKEEGEGFKAIYRFNLETRQLDPEPFLLIDSDTIRYYRGDGSFKPSGIAIQPGTGNIFILGAVGNLLLVFSQKAEMLAMIKLSSMIFPKPEGICFSPDGILYISNEGGGGPGIIMKFESDR